MELALWEYSICVDCFQGHHANILCSQFLIACVSFMILPPSILEIRYYSVGVNEKYDDYCSCVVVPLPQKECSSTAPLSGPKSGLQAGISTILQTPMNHDEQYRNMVAQPVRSRQTPLQFYFSRAIIKWVTKK